MRWPGSLPVHRQGGCMCVCARAGGGKRCTLVECVVVVHGTSSHKSTDALLLLLLLYLLPLLQCRLSSQHSLFVPPGAFTIVWSIKKFERKSIRCATFSSEGIGGNGLRLTTPSPSGSTVVLATSFTKVARTLHENAASAACREGIDGVAPFCRSKHHASHISTPSPPRE